MTWYLIITEMIDVNCLKEILDAIMEFNVILDDRSSLCYQLFCINQYKYQFKIPLKTIT